jgi:hypothetical protein
MAIVGILAVTMSVSFSRNVYDTQLTADRVRSAISYAQKLAVSSRRVVTVNFASSTITFDLCRNFTPDTVTTCPSLLASIALPDGAASIIPPAAIVKFATDSGLNSFKFDPQGRPDLVSALVVRVGNQSGTSVVGGSTVTVEAESGYAH